MPLKSLAFLLLFFFGCFSSLRKPVIGVITYMSLYIIAPSSAWWGQPVAYLGIRYSLMASIFLILGCFISGEYKLFHQWGFSGLEKCMALFLCIAWLSLLVGQGITPESWKLVDKITKVFIFIYFMTRIVVTYERYRLLRWVWVLGGLYLGYQCFTASSGMFTNGRLNGIGGPDFQGSSGLGAHLAATLPFIAVSLYVSRRWWMKAISVLAAAFVVNGLILSRTRGAFLAVGVGMALAVVWVPSQFRKKTYLILVLAIVGSLLLVDAGYWHRMDTISVDESSMGASSSSRMEIWAGSLKMLYDHPLGVGIGRFPDFIGMYASRYPHRAAHNTFVRCYGDLGLQGLIIFLLILYITYKNLRHLKAIIKKIEFYQESDEGINIALDAFALFLSLSIYLTAGFFTERIYAEGLWWIIGMSECLRRCQMNFLKKEI